MSDKELEDRLRKRGEALDKQRIYHLGYFDALENVKDRIKADCPSPEAALAAVEAVEQEGRKGQADDIRAMFGVDRPAENS